MKIFKQTIPLIIACFLVGCSGNPFIPYKYKMLENFSEKVTSATRCHLISYEMQEDKTRRITHFVMDYRFSAPIDEEISIQRARCLIVSISTSFLKMINQDAKIRPKLSHYPFLREGLTSHISLQDFEQAPLENGGVSSVSWIDGDVIYKNKEGILLKETVAEAIALCPYRILILGNEPYPPGTLDRRGKIPKVY